MDDTILSTRAEGRPKLLIVAAFGQGKPENRHELIDGIRENIGDLTGVDIYAVTTAARTGFGAFAEAHPCDGITYAYEATKTACTPYSDAEKAAGITFEEGTGKGSRHTVECGCGEQLRHYL